MRVVYFGSGEFAVPSLRWLANSKHELVSVVTPPDRPAGRGKKLMPPPAAAQAIEDGLPLVRSANVNEPAFIDQLRAWAPDVSVVADFGQKLSRTVLDAMGRAAINIHGSLLPRHRGAAPVAYAILEGDEETGVTIFHIVERMDAGPILVQRRTMIGPWETCEELEGRLSRVGCDAIDAALQMLEADPHHPGEPQDETRVTRAPKLAKADGLLRFDVPAEQIARRCRAMWPWPGGRCRYVSADGRREDVAIAVSGPVPGETTDAPGTISPVLTVATGQGMLEIHSLKPAGKRLMSWQDFANGRRVQPGDRFEPIP